MNDYQKFIHASRYARFLDGEGRRETWEESVNRYCEFWRERFPDTFPFADAYSAIINMEVVPSMRAFMCAGPALARDNMAGYNCSYIAIDDVRAFDEILYILCCGTGVGFSVERQYIAKLPCIAEEFHESETIIRVSDSKIGWATAFRELLSLLYAGKVPKWDVTGIRPAGARLKTFGGRASGPEPLVELFRFTVELFKRAAGRKLNSLECHDLVCKIADIVVVGGVRRSALISLSNLSDDRLRGSKSGQWWVDDPQRALANNSAAYTEKPDIGIFIKEWLSLYESKSGERGIFNRVAAQQKASENGRRDSSFEFGTNPCGEIILRSCGLCNLTEVVVRAGDTAEDLQRKVKLATILGTFQSTLTNFRYVRKIWQRNAEEERLLGVSLTGIQDNDLISINDEEHGAGVLISLKETAIATNVHWANKLGIAQSAAITTVKPSGTVSQLVDSASGIHTRFAPYYIRNVRNDKKDPLSDFLISQGVPYEEDKINPAAWVFSFPMKAPENAVFSADALEQLEHYRTFRDYWCEHNPSITVSVKEHEWLGVAAWVYEHFDDIGGVSFLPYSDHIYQQAPYIAITKDQYEDLVKKMPTIKWDEFRETEDHVNYREAACFAGVCEL